MYEPTEEEVAKAETVRQHAEEEGEAQVKEEDVIFVVVEADIKDDIEMEEDRYSM